MAELADHAILLFVVISPVKLPVFIIKEKLSQLTADQVKSKYISILFDQATKFLCA